MASAHGAGLMVLPVVLAGPHAHHHAAAQGAAGGVWATLIHTLGYFTVTAAVVARLSETRPGYASPVVVQPGPDLGYRTGSNRFCSVTALKFDAILLHQWTLWRAPVIHRSPPGIKKGQAILRLPRGYEPPISAAYLHRSSRIRSRSRSRSSRVRSDRRLLLTTRLKAPIACCNSRSSKLPDDTRF